MRTQGVAGDSQLKRQKLVRGLLKDKREWSKDLNWRKWWRKIANTR